MTTTTRDSGRCSVCGEAHGLYCPKLGRASWDFRPENDARARERAGEVMRRRGARNAIQKRWKREAERSRRAE